MNKLKQYNYRSARKSIIAAIIMYFIVIALFAAILITTSFLDRGPDIDPNTHTPNKNSVIFLYFPVFATLFIASGISGLLLLIPEFRNLAQGF